MVCLFCLNETFDGVSLHGASELAEHARTIIAKHFWFDVKEIDSVESHACSRCWSEVNSFHNFYIMVEANYQDKPNKISTTDSVNPQQNCKLEKIYEKTIKMENDETDMSLLENESVFVESISVWDDFSEEGDSPKNEVNLTSQERLANAHTSSAPNQESVSIDRSRRTTKKRKMARQNERSKLLKQKISTPIKSTKSQSIATTETRSSMKRFECFICRKKFAKIRGVRNHMHIHDPFESRIFECNSCDKSFSRKNILKQHIKYHEVKKKYDKNSDKYRIKTSCPICQKELNRGSLKAHILTMHENKKSVRQKTHMCERCGKEFDAPSTLARHKLTHIDRSYTEIKCHICGKLSKNQETYRRHIVIHRKTPLKCPHCDAVEYSGSDLKTHISQFHAMHKHQCTICNRSFAKAMRLKEHLATHLNESIYSCLYCAKTFRCSTVKYEHVKNHHPNEWSLNHDKRKVKKKIG